MSMQAFYEACASRDVPAMRKALAEQGTPGPADGRPHLQLYAILFVVIGGDLQAQETKVDVRFGPGKVRVYVRWAVPQSGLEFDGRELVRTGAPVTVDAVGPLGKSVVARPMRCTWFAVGHAVNTSAAARAIFECDDPGAD